MSEHFITLAEAIAMTSLYRNDKENILAEGYKYQGILPVCETFRRDAIDAILRQNDCQALRFYYSMHSDQKVCLIVVGVNSNDQDILPTDQSGMFAESGSEGLLGQEAIRCPTTCPPPSPLNEPH